MLEAGVIRPSTSPWTSPIVIVEKKDGGLRFCVDYRRLIQLSKFDAYPMPHIEEVFESVGSSMMPVAIGRFPWLRGLGRRQRLLPLLASLSLPSCLLGSTALQRLSNR